MDPYLVSVTVTYGKVVACLSCPVGSGAGWGIDHQIIPLTRESAMLKIDSNEREYCLPCADTNEIEGVIVDRAGTCVICSPEREGKIHKCAECGDVTLDKGYKAQDSFHGLQYLCSQDCVDGYEGWWCDTCGLLHDHGTTMESDNSCQKEGE